MSLCRYALFGLLLCAGLLPACQPRTPGLTQRADGAPVVAWPYSSNLVYARAPDLLRQYATFLVDKVGMLQTDTGDFSGISLDEQATMSFFTSQAYRQAFIRNGFALADAPGEGVARVKIYLVDMRPSVPVGEGAVYTTPAGEIDLSDADFRGRSAFTGGVTLVGEISDSESGATLMGFVESSSQTNLDPVRAFARWFPAQSAIEASANTLAIGWRALMRR